MNALHFVHIDILKVVFRMAAETIRKQFILVYWSNNVLPECINIINDPHFPSSCYISLPKSEWE